MCEMCGCGKEAFMGNEMPNQSVFDVGATGIPATPTMFNTDSLDTLGTSQDFPLTSAPQVEMN
jgi:hypothetical protein